VISFQWKREFLHARHREKFSFHGAYANSLLNYRSAFPPVSVCIIYHLRVIWTVRFTGVNESRDAPSHFNFSSITLMRRATLACSSTHEEQTAEKSRVLAHYFDDSLDDLGSQYRSLFCIAHQVLDLSLNSAINCQ